MSSNGKVKFNCSLCRELIEFDISGFHPKNTIETFYICSQNHKTVVFLRSGMIIDITPKNIESDLLTHPKVPDHIKEFVREAVICLNEKAPKAGATMVRLMLDGLLFEMGCKADFVGDKVNELETMCKVSPFKEDHKPICKRLSTFRAISGLAGYHAHMQPKLLDVDQTEFESFFNQVSAAIREWWK